ncbi:MAG: PDDEXK nuclease domain-containing protein [Bacteroidales bacterium]|nr:PDDEXK nuclease domain-containing protein [Bacteroidales bacterium]
MEKESSLLHNKEYLSWVKELKQRYLSARLKASVEVNRALLELYWSIGKDIAEKQYTNTYGSKFYATLSHDLREELPNVKGLSPTNLKYMVYFYNLYSQLLTNRPHPADDSKEDKQQQVATDLVSKNRQQPADDFELYPYEASIKNSIFRDICSIPWDHQRRIISKCNDNPEKALFFVRKVLENNWGRDMLLNFLDTNLYERQGKAITNFKSALPTLKNDLAQQITKDPYNFDFLSLREEYDEKELEDALVNNVAKFLVELGTGFAFMGRQYRLLVGETECFIDLLFYNTKIHAYCCVELKTGSFHPGHLGQLGYYVSAVNHLLKSDIDNPTIGILICKDKNNIEAQYSLETYNVPLGISEYKLTNLIPSEFQGTLPTIEEIESNLEKLSSEDN